MYILHSLSVELHLKKGPEFKTDASFPFFIPKGVNLYSIETLSFLYPALPMKSGAFYTPAI